jgi:hypothetical protein
MQTADNDNAAAPAGEAISKKVLSPAAERSLREAEQRRKQAQPQQPAEEFGGRGGADPARFGDWEINGRAIDF